MLEILYYRLKIAWCTVRIYFWQAIIDLYTWVERLKH